MKAILLMLGALSAAIIFVGCGTAVGRATGASTNESITSDVISPSSEATIEMNQQIEALIKEVQEISEEADKTKQELQKISEPETPKEIPMLDPLQDNLSFNKALEEAFRKAEEERLVEEAHRQVEEEKRVARQIQEAMDEASAVEYCEESIRYAYEDYIDENFFDSTIDVLATQNYVRKQFQNCIFSSGLEIEQDFPKSVTYEEIAEAAKEQSDTLLYLKCWELKDDLDGLLQVSELEAVAVEFDDCIAEHPSADDESESFHSYVAEVVEPPEYDREWALYEKKRDSCWEDALTDEEEDYCSGLTISHAPEVDFTIDLAPLVTEVEEIYESSVNGTNEEKITDLEIKLNRLTFLVDKLLSELDPFVTDMELSLYRYDDELSSLYGDVETLILGEDYWLSESQELPPPTP